MADSTGFGLAQGVGGGGDTSARPSGKPMTTSAKPAGAPQASDAAPSGNVMTPGGQQSQGGSGGS